MFLYVAENVTECCMWSIPDLLNKVIIQGSIDAVNDNLLLK